MKSFHLEQVITRQFLENPEEDLIGALFYFFTEISNIVDHPDCIEDRAQRGKYIDDYLKTITDRQKSIIKKTKDMVLVRLESIDDYEVEYIFKAQEYNRDPARILSLISGIYQWLIYRINLILVMTSKTNLRIVDKGVRE